MFSMTNPLTSLDELIWKQFEKVTQYAHKNYGWDKYDLTNIMETTTGGLMMGYGTYLVTAATMTNSFSSGIGYSFLGTGTGLFGILFASFSRRRNENERAKELQELMETSTVTKPHYTAIRPSVLLGFTYMATQGLLDYQIKNKNFGVALDFAIITGGLGSIFLVATSYFKDQIMTPPTIKKPFWKTTYERMRNKFKPKPQLEPAAEPASQYATIDTLVT